MEDFSVKALFAKIHKSEQIDFGANSYQRVPLQLIKFNKENRLKLCKPAEEMLRHLVGKIAVVGVSGPCRTGKSSLLNLLVSSSGRGFQLNHNNSNATKGIWIWGEPMATKENSILFLDCEGTKPIEETTINDARLFSLMLLLSSVFIYNSRGVIDEHAVNQIALAESFSKIIDFSTGYADSEVEMMERATAEAPKLVWILRDFHLAITDDEVNPLSSKDYMENILNMPSFMGKNASKNSKIRESILQP